VHVRRRQPGGAVVARSQWCTLEAALWAAMVTMNVLTQGTSTTIDAPHAVSPHQLSVFKLPHISCHSIISNRGEEGNGCTMRCVHGKHQGKLHPPRSLMP
jgi:hypothetical protein